MQRQNELEITSSLINDTRELILTQSRAFLIGGGEDEQELNSVTVGDLVRIKIRVRAKERGVERSGDIPPIQYLVPVGPKDGIQNDTNSCNGSRANTN